MKTNLKRGRIPRPTSPKAAAARRVLLLEEAAKVRAQLDDAERPEQYPTLADYDAWRRRAESAHALFVEEAQQLGAWLEAERAKFEAEGADLLRRAWRVLCDVEIRVDLLASEERVVADLDDYFALQDVERVVVEVRTGHCVPRGSATRDALERFLAKFPDDATSWAAATDELPDMYRWMTQVYNLWPIELLDEYGRAKELDVLAPIGRENCKTPANWNQKYKAAIRQAFDKFVAVDELLGAFRLRFADWLESPAAEPAKCGNRACEDCYEDGTARVHP